MRLAIQKRVSGGDFLIRVEQTEAFAEKYRGFDVSVSAKEVSNMWSILGLS